MPVVSDGFWRLGQKKWARDLGASQALLVRFLLGDPHLLGSAQTDGDQMAAVAAVVTATAPLFVLILFFQRQIVSGLTAGSVKG